MPDPEFVSLDDGVLIADEAWLAGILYGTGNGATPAVPSWEFVDLSLLEETPPVEPTLGGLGIVYPGKRHVFSGPQESAKTLAAYVIGLEVVRSGARVVLLDFEMGRYDARTRFREIGASQEELERIVYVEPGEPPQDADTGALVAMAPELVIVDASAGAFAVSDLDDNKRQDVERFSLRWIEPFRRAGIATIILDHVVKNTETRGAYAIGSERKVGGADVHLGFEVRAPVKRGGSGLYRIVTHKDRGGFLRRGRLRDFKLESDPDTNVISWELVEPAEIDGEHPMRYTGIMEKISRYLEMPGMEPVSANTIEKAKLGKRAEHVREALARLVAESFVAKIETSNGNRYESISPFRDDEIGGSSGFVPGSSENWSGGGSSARPTPYGGDEAGRAADEGGTNLENGTIEIPF